MLSPGLSCASVCYSPLGRASFASHTPFPYWALDPQGEHSVPSEQTEYPVVEARLDFYWSAALLASLTRENLGFLEIQGQRGKLDSEENRYEVLGLSPFLSSKGSVNARGLILSGQAAGSWRCLGPPRKMWVSSSGSLQLSFCSWSVCWNKGRTVVNRECGMQRIMDEFRMLTTCMDLSVASQDCQFLLSSYKTPEWWEEGRIKKDQEIGYLFSVSSCTRTSVVHWATNIGKIRKILFSSQK